MLILQWSRSLSKFGILLNNLAEIFIGQSCSLLKGTIIIYYNDYHDNWWPWTISSAPRTKCNGTYRSARRKWRSYSAVNLNEEHRRDIYRWSLLNCSESWPMTEWAQQSSHVQNVLTSPLPPPPLPYTYSKKCTLCNIILLILTNINHNGTLV